MATSQSLYPTMLDIARRLDPNGKIADIAEMMDDVNPILTDMVFQECNDGTQNVTTVRNGLPTAAWIRAYKGYTPSKSTTTQVSDATGNLGSMSEVDVKVLNRYSDKAAFRLSEAHPHIEAMNQEMANTLFYGNSTDDPDEFTGLSLRFSAHSGTDDTKTSFNVIDGGGSGSTNTSIWMVGWGPRTVFGLYPQGTKAGLAHTDKGEQSVRNATTGVTYFAVVDVWDWNLGLAVRDWRAVSRICNVDTAKLGATGEANLLDLMTDAYYKVERRMSGARFAIYCNQTIAKFLDKQSRNEVAAGAGLDFDNVQGKKVLSFRGIPIRVCDALVSTEAAVSEAS
jgi:hypothetical protein